MWRHDHLVFGAVDHLPFFTGIGAPQDKDHVFLFVRYFFDDRIGKFLPAFFLVGAGRGGPDGERGIEQQHPLLCPTPQIPRRRKGLSQVVLHLFKDIHQRRREPHPLAHGKTQAIGLAGAVVRVLPQYHHFHPVKPALVEGAENLPARGENGMFAILFLYKTRQFPEVILFKLLPELFFPRRCNPDIHAHATIFWPLNFYLVGSKIEKINIFDRNGNRNHSRY